MRPSRAKARPFARLECPVLCGYPGTHGLQTAAQEAAGKATKAHPAAANAAALACLNKEARDEPERIEAIHSARRCLKRGRSLLYLIRCAEPYIYRVENQSLRDTGRLLAPLRDRDATREAINIICADALPIHSERCRAMQSLLLELHTQRTALRDVKDAQIIGLARESLENITARQTTLKLGKLGDRELAKRIRDATHELIQAHELALDNPVAENLHAWRKTTRRLTDVSQLCAERLHIPAEEYRESLDAIIRALGQHQDLLVLETWLRSEPSFQATSAEGQTILRWLGELREIRRLAGLLDHGRCAGSSMGRPAQAALNRHA